MHRILLVEDNVTNREMLTRRLLRYDFEILIAEDGEQAVSVASDESPDLILMDMSLPVIDGWEATRRIRANMLTREIPIIGLSAHAMTKDRNKALEAGCDDYDTKPIDMKRLLEKMHHKLN